MTVFSPARFSVQHTRRGDYIVRWYSRDIARVATLAEAETIRFKAEADSAARSADMERAAKKHQAFLDAHADLRTRQIAWQDWRNKQYAEFCREARHVETLRRIAGIASAGGSGNSDNRRSDAEASAKSLDALWARYNALCGLDAASKDAIRIHDAESWSASLNACDSYMAVA